MKTVFCSFGLLMAAVPVFAQNTGKDSIVSTKALDDVVVSASNISRVGDHLVIYPNSQQRKHAVNGFGVLENLNIPGLIIDAKSNQVDVMGLQATLYLNGQECDIREIQMLRPRDIEKIDIMMLHRENTPRISLSSTSSPNNTDMEDMCRLTDCRR